MASRTDVRSALKSAPTTQFEKYLETLRQKEWQLGEDLPFYEPGMAHDAVKWRDFNYLDYYEKMIGRPYGANGIGKLREVALIKHGEAQNDPYIGQDPVYFGRMKNRISELDPDNLEKQHRCQDAYAKLLEENGVEVHWMEIPRPVIGPFGPILNYAGAAAGCFTLRGGLVIGKYAVHPYGHMRGVYFARWALQELGIPTLHMIHGSGVCEVGACIWLAEDIFVTARSASFNEEGLNQLIPVVKASSKEDVYVHVMRLPGGKYSQDSVRIGQHSHPNVIIGALDIGKVMVHPPSIDFETYDWLRQHKFDIVEVDTEEHVRHWPISEVILEPGKVMMNADAKNTIAKVRAIGVEVVEVEWGEMLKQRAGTLGCATGLLRRDLGPSFFKDR